VTVIPAIAFYVVEDDPDEITGYAQAAVKGGPYETYEQANEHLESLLHPDAYLVVERETPTSPPVPSGVRYVLVRFTDEVFSGDSRFDYNPPLPHPADIFIDRMQTESDFRRDVGGEVILPWYRRD
jgi:hypothetical protein